MDDLNLGGFVNIWGRYDNFVLSGDIMYVNTADSHATGPLPALQIPGIVTIPAGASMNADLDTQEFMATLHGGYRVLNTPEFSLDTLGALASGTFPAMCQSRHAIH